MEQKQTLFRQSTLARVTSPDQLNDYIRVANPSVWVVLVAVVILLVSLMVWGVFGTLPTTVQETCIANDGVLTCYMADAGGVTPGLAVRIGEDTGTVSSVSETPYSSREISNRYQDDYTVHMLGVEDWNYEIQIVAPDVPDGMVEATIVTGEIRPITFIFN